MTYSYFVSRLISNWNNKLFSTETYGICYLGKCFNVKVISVLQFLTYYSKMLQSLNVLAAY